MDYYHVMDMGLKEWEDGYTSGIERTHRRGRRKARTFTVDPDYYHKWVEVDDILESGEKAFKVRKDGFTFWLPHKAVRAVNDKHIFIHGITFEKIFFAAREREKTEFVLIVD